ncbi:MAG: hypothetical protein RI907_2540 [Pseudomonadota bacterium]
MFIHSTGTGPSMWKDLSTTLPQGVTAWLPVNLGYSPEAPLHVPPGQVFRLEDEVAHLRRLMPADTRRLHLVAHSYGAAVALLLAVELEAAARAGAGADVPQVASLWLYEPTPFAALRALPQGALPADVQAQLHTLFGEDSPLLNPDLLGQDTWLQAFIDYWNGPGTWAAVPERVRQGARLVGPKMFHEVQALTQRAPSFEHMRVAAPITLVHGETTHPPARHMAERLHAEHPHSHLQALVGLGHMGPMSAPAVRDSLQAHWQRVCAPA